MKRLRPLLAIAAALLIFAADTTSVASGATSEPLGPDDEYVAQTLDVSRQDLATRNALRDRINALGEHLQDQPGYGGMYYTWAPFRVVVALTHDAPSGTLSIVRDSGLSDRVDTVQVDSTIADLQAALRTWVSQRDAGTLPPFDGSIEVRSNAIALTTQAEYVETLTQALERAAVGSRTAAAGKIRYTVSAAPLARPTTIGGANLSNGCTAAFMWKSTTSSVFGVMSAGHQTCNANATYSSGNISTTVLTAKLGSERDSSLHRLNGGSVSNDLYATPYPYIRAITYLVGWSSVHVGDYICKEGRTSGYACSDVLSTNIAPSYAPNSTRFIRVNTRCVGGDSGGPWYYNNMAYGIQSGALVSDGDCIFGSMTWAIPPGYALYTK